MALSKEQILQADDLKTIDLNVPEWGGSVRIRTMTGEARQQFQEAINAPKGKLPKNVMEALLVSCLVDDAGGQLFSAEDIEALSRKNSSVLQRVWEAAAELNGLTERSIKDIEKK